MSQQEQTTVLCTKGRKVHNFYKVMKYNHKRLENGRLAAQCTVCNVVLKNTAISRLRTHRKRCHSESSKDSVSETYSDDTTKDFGRENEEIQLEPEIPSSQENSEINGITEEQILLEIYANTETDYNDVIAMQDDEVEPHDSHVKSTNFTVIKNDALQNIFSSAKDSEEVYVPDHAYSSDYPMGQPQRIPNIFNSNSPLSSSSLGASCSSLSTKSYTPCSTPEIDPKFCENRNKISKKLKKKGSNKSNRYIDTMTPKLKEEIDVSLAKFFFGCNIPFSIIESDHFKNFINILRPAYSLPCRKTLSTVLLDKVSEEMVATNKKYLVKESTLLINGKNSSNNTNNVVTMLQTAGGQSLFLESYDFSTLRETGEALADICQKSIEVAQSRYNCEVYAVVSDNASMCKMGRITTLWHTTCNSHTGNLLAKDIIDIGTITTVNNILKEFKHTNLENLILENGGTKIVLPVDTLWCSNRDACVSFIKNLPIMKKIVAEGGVKIKPDITYSFYDDDFIDNVNATIVLLNPVSELINKCQSINFSIADAAEEWIHLKNKMLKNDEYKRSITNAIERRFKMAMNIYCLTANFLHPVYRGRQLDSEQLNYVEDFLLETLDHEGLNGLNVFNRNEGLFEKLSGKKATSVDTFWGLAARKFPSLAALAQKLLKIPASSAQVERVFSNWSFVHSAMRNRLTKERSTKLVFVYYSLRLRDSNSSDQY